MKKAEDENGFIGKGWSGFKNLTGIGDSSDKVREQQKKEQNLLAQFNSNPQRRAEIFKQLTGADYNPENLEKFIKGQIKLPSELALTGYKEGQEMAVDVVADVVSGVVSFGVVSACTAAGVAATPFTAGASLGLVVAGAGIAAGTGALVKTGLKYADAKSGGRDYTLKDARHDAATGAFSGALAPITAGAGGAVGKVVTTQAAKVVGKEVLQEGVKLTAKQTAAKALAFTAEVATDGALGGGVDNAFRTAVDGGSAEEIFDAGITGAEYGAILGPVMGWGAKGIGKGYKAAKEVYANIPFGKLPEDVPQVIIPKKTTTNLYPESDVSELMFMKLRLKNSASGTENIELSEISGKPYKVTKEVTKTREIFCFDAEGKDVPVGSEYKKIETFNDGTYTIYKSTQSGSNPGFWVEHGGSGDLYYFKTGNGQQNITEHVSSQLYRAAGIDTPDMNLVAAPGFNDMVSSDKCWIKSKAITGLKPLSENLKGAYEGFAVDAWLANWDAVCSGNTLLKNGTAVRVDFGGTLDFRARGARKAFGNEVHELSTLLDPNINPESARVFQNMTREDLIGSLERVQSVTDNDIQNLYSSVRVYINPEIFTKISNRKQYLNFVLQEAKIIPMKPNQTIQDYVKTLETNVSKKYKSKISAMNDNSVKRTRVMRDMKEQRDAVCSDEDLKAIWEYKGNSCIANSCIQRGDFENPLVTTLDEALSKTTLTEPMLLYRGDHLSCDFNRLNLRYKESLPEIEKLFEDKGKLFMTRTENGETIKTEITLDEIAEKIFKKGRIIEEQQFVSTTVDPVVSKQFGQNKLDIIYRYHAPKGINATCPENLNPKVVGNSHASAMLLGNGGLEGSEAEILLKRGFKYRQDKLSIENGQYVIDCTILPD